MSVNCNCFYYIDSCDVCESELHNNTHQPISLTPIVCIYSNKVTVIVVHLSFYYLFKLSLFKYKSKNHS